MNAVAAWAANQSDTPPVWWRPPVAPAPAPNGRLTAGQWGLLEAAARARLLGLPDAPVWTRLAGALGPNALTLTRPWPARGWDVWQLETYLLPRAARQLLAAAGADVLAVEIEPMPDPDARVYVFFCAAPYAPDTDWPPRRTRSGGGYA